MVLSDLLQDYEVSMKFFYNDEVAISIDNNPAQHDRTKYVEIDKHFIEERYNNGNICIPYILSNQQIYDILTKGLLKQSFGFCVNKLGLIDIYVLT